ncbi:MAG: preprotein translocase subunit YidC [Parcubacteria group bacterium Gr01-1014_18]|nr:MAG: preprotein translocase subunit YidC [Parcubacteria group bacterium Greene0416_36]TSC81155.1 MAG: preprotein translocase subunit YidC [Parcubacteria group bacterium Gr01-1014_18]TSC99152.1 MAG: preprotein translocase subunit YidC [Parcubacteria group bacterium Greene1014_20]TSD07490.1 MAG: preprotein translocase subunit YidC [Parcubacteria group bacterium Greene0714_2]
MSLFDTFLYQPLFNLLVLIYNFIPGSDIGLAIIGLTLIVKLILYPLSKKALESQKSLQAIQPKVQELKVKHGKDQQALAADLMKVYSENKVNPFSSCLPILIQIPVFIALYQVFQHGLDQGSGLDMLYSFVENPGTIDPVSFGLVDLAKPQPVLAVLAAVSQYLQTKMMMANNPPPIAGSTDEATVAMMNKQMLYMMPILTLVISFGLPGGLTLYWFVSTLLMMAQQSWMFREVAKK